MLAKDAKDQGATRCRRRALPRRLLGADNLDRAGVCRTRAQLESGGADRQRDHRKQQEEYGFHSRQSYRQREAHVAA